MLPISGALTDPQVLPVLTGNQVKGELVTVPNRHDQFLVLNRNSAQNVDPKPILGFE